MLPSYRSCLLSYNVVVNVHVHVNVHVVFLSSVVFHC